MFYRKESIASVNEVLHILLEREAGRPWLAHVHFLG